MSDSYQKNFTQILDEFKSGDKSKAFKKQENYLKNNPNGYCPNHSTGVKFEKEDKVTEVKKTKDDLIPLQGKEIIVVESEGFCPYCVKLILSILL